MRFEIRYSGYLRFFIFSSIYISIYIFCCACFFLSSYSVSYAKFDASVKWMPNFGEYTKHRLDSIVGARDVDITMDAYTKGFYSFGLSTHYFFNKQYIKKIKDIKIGIGLDLDYAFLPVVSDNRLIDDGEDGETDPHDYTGIEPYLSRLYRDLDDDRISYKNKEFYDVPFIRYAQENAEPISLKDEDFSFLDDSSPNNVSFSMPINSDLVVTNVIPFSLNPNAVDIGDLLDLEIGAKRKVPLGYSFHGIEKKYVGVNVDFEKYMSSFLFNIELGAGLMPANIRSSQIFAELKNIDANQVEVEVRDGAEVETKFYMFSYKGQFSVGYMLNYVRLNLGLGYTGALGGSSITGSVNNPVHSTSGFSKNSGNSEIFKVFNTLYALISATFVF